MIDPAVVDAFNNRTTVDLNNIKKMTPADQDRVKANGSAAEALLSNKSFAQFVHQFKFEVCDALSEIKTHKEEDNALRVSLSNQLAGIDGFINTLKRAVYFKNRVVTLQQDRLVDEPNT